MSCPCKGFGIVRFQFHDGSPTQYGVCLCLAGMDMRCTANGNRETGYALWQVWAYRQQVQPEHVGMIEEFLDEAELAAMFPNRQVETEPVQASASQIAAAMRTTQGKL